MFLKRLLAESRPSSERRSSDRASSNTEGEAECASTSKTERTGTATSSEPDAQVGLVLDALGGVLTVLARYPIDMPDRTSEASARELTQWQRHATMGYAVDESEEKTCVGVAERDWTGVVRAVTEQRREEHRYVQASISELRDALWACIETVHKALKLDHAADATADQQVERAKNALQRLQTGSIKQEVLGAVLSIESTLQERREQQHEQYASLATRLDRLGRQLEEARRDSTTDPLTKLGNRKLFDVVAARAVQMHSMAHQPATMLMIDLDKLKTVNDLYGHQAGDRAIQNLGTALSRVFLRQTDVLCRFGGDEFGVVLHNTDWKMAVTLGKRLHEQLESMPPPHPAMEFSIAASVGVAQLDLHEDVEEWVARADRALYKAKRSSRDRVCVEDTLLLKSA